MLMMDRPLRAWQDAAILFFANLFQTAAHGYLQAPAGAGKTIGIAHIGEDSALPGTRILVVGRDNIAQQHRDVLISLGFLPSDDNPKRFTAPQSYNTWIVTTWQAVARNPKKYAAEPCAILFVDEAHLGCSDDDNVSIRKIIAVVAPEKRVAVSATISTVSEKLFGPRDDHLYVYRMDAAYEDGVLHDVNIVEVETGLRAKIAKVRRIEDILGVPWEQVEEMSDDTLDQLATKIIRTKKPLVMPSFTPNPQSPVERAAVQTATMIIRHKHACLMSIYLAKHRGEQAVFFCPNVSVADWACERFNEHQGVARSVHVHNPDRVADIAAFRAGTVRVLFVVDMLQEGFSMPALWLGFDCRFHRNLNKWRMARMLHRLGRLQRLDPDDPNKPVGLFYVGSDLTHYLPPNYTYGKWGAHSPLAARLLAAGNGLHQMDDEIDLMPSTGAEVEIKAEFGEDAEDAEDDGEDEPAARASRTIKFLATPFYVVRKVLGSKTVRTASLRELSHAGPTSADENKRLLREIAAAGAPRPTKREPLGVALSNYTSPTHAYDAEFRAFIQAVAPEWLKQTRSYHMAELMALPLGTPRPLYRDRLGTKLAYLTTGKYQLSEREQAPLRARFPHWFPVRVSLNEHRATLLAMPPDSPRLEPDTELHQAWRNISNKGSRCYQAEVDEALRARQPLWYARPGKRNAFVGGAAQPPEITLAAE